MEKKLEQTAIRRFSIHSSSSNKENKTLYLFPKNLEAEDQNESLFRDH